MVYIAGPRKEENLEFLRISKGKIAISHINFEP